MVVVLTEAVCTYIEMHTVHYFNSVGPDGEGRTHDFFFFFFFVFLNLVLTLFLEHPLT